MEAHWAVSVADLVKLLKYLTLKVAVKILIHPSIRIGSETFQLK